MRGLRSRMPHGTARQFADKNNTISGLCFTVPGCIVIDMQKPQCARCRREQAVLYQHPDGLIEWVGTKCLRKIWEDYFEPMPEGEVLISFVPGNTKGDFSLLASSTAGREILSVHPQF